MRKADVACKLERRMRLAIVGVGKMGRSILEGILKAEFLAPQEVGVVDIKEYAQGVAASMG